MAYIFKMICVIDHNWDDEVYKNHIEKGRVYDVLAVKGDTVLIICDDKRIRWVPSIWFKFHSYTT